MTYFDTATMTYDGIHPNAAGEEFIATRMYRPLRKLIRPGSCTVASPMETVAYGPLFAFGLWVLGLRSRRRSA